MATAKEVNFDAVYKEYKKKYMEDKMFLTERINKYKAFKEEGGSILSKEVIGDIGSTIGQATLLLQSKLPQFEELLLGYLNKTSNPPVLACDLQGWYEVASLQIEQLKTRFEKLEKEWGVDVDNEGPMKSPSTPRIWFVKI